MAVLDIGEPTGMEADISSLDTKAAPTYRRIERHFRKVTLYFSEVIYSIVLQYWYAVFCKCFINIS